MYTLYIYTHVYLIYTLYITIITVVYIILSILIQIHYILYIYPIEPSFGGLMLSNQLCFFFAYTCIPFIYIYTTYNYYNSCIYIILCIVIQIHYYIYIYISHWTFFWWIDVVHPAVHYLHPPLAGDANPIASIDLWVN